jgi:hemerythrin-like domain-containing protein
MEEERRRARSEAFRRAHHELLELIETMTPRLVASELQRDATDARAMLSMLAGKLTVHLAMEDKALYPRLATHANLDVRRLAEQFEKEMGGIFAVFKQYLAHWPNAEAIQMNGAGFVVETRQIFDALQARIAKEDAHIFPRLDET